MCELQSVSPDKLREMDPEYAFIDWCNSDARLPLAEEIRAELSDLDAELQIRAAL